MMSRFLNYICISIVGFAIGLCANSSRAYALVQYDVKTITVEVTTNFSIDHTSPDVIEMRNLLFHSTILGRGSIQRKAIAYLKSKLKDEVKVESSDRLNEDRKPDLPSTLMLRLDYTIWPHTIEGKRVLIGAVAVSPEAGKNVEHNGWTDATRGWQPVDTFVVGATDQETQENIDAMLARLLSRYAAVQHN
jgi:hypothetical protein